MYTWLKSRKPILAYAGSANYTLTGFSGIQREVLAKCDSNSAGKFYESILEESISCRDLDIEERISLTDHPARRQTPQLGSVELSLLDSTSGETHKKAGLNWGQRPGRHPDQAYIPIPSRIYNTDFFPPIGQHFEVLTDDGEIFTFVRAQQHGKALHTSLDNSLMGLYFRTRIGVRSGEFVHTQDLLEYGRTAVEMLKVDDKNYLLDFSVDSKKQLT